MLHDQRRVRQGQERIWNARGFQHPCRDDHALISHAVERLDAYQARNVIGTTAIEQAEDLNALDKNTIVRVAK